MTGNDDDHAAGVHLEERVDRPGSFLAVVHAIPTAAKRIRLVEEQAIANILLQELPAFSSRLALVASNNIRRRHAFEGAAHHARRQEELPNLRCEEALAGAGRADKSYLQAVTASQSNTSQEAELHQLEDMSI